MDTTYTYRDILITLIDLLLNYKIRDKNDVITDDALLTVDFLNKMLNEFVKHGEYSFCHGGLEKLKPGKLQINVGKNAKLTADYIIQDYLNYDDLCNTKETLIKMRITDVVNYALMLDFLESELKKENEKRELKERGF